MKFLIVFVALFALALARPSGPSGPSDVQIVRSESDVQPEGFVYGYETSDGTKVDSDGKLKDVGTDHEAIVVHGTFTWVDTEGKSHTITYVADENGYQPTGADIPVAV